MAHTAKFGYKDFIPLFRAEHFDSCGMGRSLRARRRSLHSIAPVAEHCDGFAMYASDMTPWNAAAMGPRRDVVGELAAATRARGLYFRRLVAHGGALVVVRRSAAPFPSDVRDGHGESANLSDRCSALYGHPAAAMNLPGPDGNKFGTTKQGPREPDLIASRALAATPIQAWLNKLAWLTPPSSSTSTTLTSFTVDWWIGLAT